MIKYLQLHIILLCTLLVTNVAKSQSLRYSLSQPYISLSGYSNAQLDPFSFTGNQAALAGIKQSGIGLYGERRFMLQELSSTSLAAAFKTKQGNFGVQANYFGFKNFNENKVGLAYARNLGSKLAIGAQFNYYNYRVPAYNSASALNFELGVIAHLTEKLNAGLHIYNPVGGELNQTEKEKLASAYKLGFGYDASDQFYISAEFVKEQDQAVNVVGGISYQFARKFFARGGFVSETGSAFAGFGVGLNVFRLDVAANYHPQLGLSPGLSLIANFKKEK